jgi:hypothetical protein
MWSYTARTWREGRWWVIQIKDGNEVTLGYTKARWRWQVKGMVVDWLLTRYGTLSKEDIVINLVHGVDTVL